MRIHISVGRQLLTLFDDETRVLREYRISTGKAGVGEVFGSFQTPRGRHLIRAKIGAGATARHQAHACLARAPADRQGARRPGQETARRYVYIHGAPENVQMGTPASHGCIRMQNADIVDLFERVPVYTPVEISED